MLLSSAIAWLTDTWEVGGALMCGTVWVWACPGATLRCDPGRKVLLSSAIAWLTWEVGGVWAELMS